MTTLIPKYDQGGTGAVNRPINQKLGEIISVLDFGADPTGVLDSAPAFNAAIAAVNSSNVTIMAEGIFTLNSPIIWNKAGITLDGGNRVYSILQPGKADISSGSYPNAMIVNTVNATNGTIKSLRFNQANSFTGWCISAVEGGTGGQQALFSMALYDLWVSPGSLAAGFVTGGMYDSWADNIQFESCKTRFDLNIGANNVNITNINEYVCYDELVKVGSFGGNNITISNVISNDNARAFLFDFTNVANININNVQHNHSAGTNVDPVGLLQLNTCTNVNFTNFESTQTAGEAKGIYVISSKANIAHGWINNVDGYLKYPLYVEGANNDVSFDDVNVIGSNYGQIVTNGAGGDLVVTNCSLINGYASIIGNLGTETINVTFDGCKLLNSNITTASVMMPYATSGRFKIINCDLGKNSVSSLITYLFQFTGTGQLVIGNNTIVGLGTSGEYHPGNTQVVTFISPNVGGTSYRAGSATPVGSVTPLFLSELYFNVTGNHFYMAYGTANTEWSALS